LAEIDDLGDKLIYMVKIVCLVAL